MEKRDILDALARYDAGSPERLRELNARLTTPATVTADAAMAVSGNELDERGQFLSNLAAFDFISVETMLELALPSAPVGA